MKTNPSTCRRSSREQRPIFSSLAGPVRPGRWILAAGCLGLIANPAPAQANQLDVGVRSHSVDKSFAPPGGKSNLPEAAAQGKIYAILSVQLIPEEGKMVKPVDAGALLQQVRHELDTHGFRPRAKGESPEILLTVQYGRAWLFNPYLGAEGQTALGITSKRTDGGEISMETVTGSTAVLMKQMELGVEHKIQKAQNEKLCIKLTAWQYTRDPKAKARQLWATTMLVDDPDHRDLNAIAAEMLAAGAPYFSREIKEEEIDVYQPVPDGRVNVGAPEVVGPPAPRSE